MLVVVGGSCTGKTRTLYEAVTATLPDWHLTAPRNDTDLKRLLEQGIAPRSVVWLDELQRHLTTTADGIAATKALYDKLETHGRNQVVFVSTIWPANLNELESRPVPQQARGGGEEAPGLIRRMQPQDRIYVPDGFTEDQIGGTTDEQAPQCHRHRPRRRQRHPGPDHPSTSRRNPADRSPLWTTPATSRLYASCDGSAHCGGGSATSRHS